MEIRIAREAFNYCVILHRTVNEFMTVHSSMITVQQCCYDVTMIGNYDSEGIIRYVYITQNESVYHVSVPNDYNYEKDWKLRF